MPDPVRKQAPKSIGKDHTKYLYNGEVYGKGRLVLAVVNDYVSSNPGISYDKLKNVFPDSIRGGSNGVFSRRQVIEEKFAVKANKHHFLKPDEIITLKDSDITVCVDWSTNNIYRFIDAAKGLGITIEDEQI